MGSTGFRSIAVLVLLGSGAWACVQKPPVRILQQEGYSAGTLNRVDSRQPPVIRPELDSEQLTLTEWEDGIFKLEFTGPEAERVRAALSVADEPHPDGGAVRVKTGMHLSCQRRPTESRCTVVLSFPGGEAILRRRAERILFSTPEGDLAPFEGTHFDLEQIPDGRVITAKIQGEAARVLARRLDPEVGGRHLNCGSDSPPVCRIRFDARDGSVLSPGDRR